MILEQQVCTTEQGLKLHKLGVVKNESYFQWMEVVCNDTEKKWAIFRPNTGEFDRMCDDPVHDDIDGEDFETARECSAFTVAELLLMNNQTITINNLQCMKPAEALADHLIGRLERGEVTPEECNQRLSK